jgi:hypothetical protein
MVTPNRHLDIAKYTSRLRPANAVFSLGEIKKRQMSPSFAPQHLAVGRADLQQPNEKKTGREIMFEYQAVMSIVERTRKGPGIGIGRRKFGRICQRFWFALGCASRGIRIWIACLGQAC